MPPEGLEPSNFLVRSEAPYPIRPRGRLPFLILINIVEKNKFLS